MSETGNTGDDRLDRLIEEVGEMREELSRLRYVVTAPQSTEEGHKGAVERSMAEFRKLPRQGSETSFRWGFMGAWGKGGADGAQHSVVSVRTTSLESFLAHTTSEDIAAFAGIFTEPHTIAICKSVFRHGGRVEREVVERECGLDGQAFAAAIRPLFEWRFIELKRDWVEASGMGVNFAVTLMAMAEEGVKQKGGYLDER